MTTTTLQVQGMSCGHCVQSVEKAVKEVGAIASVDLAQHSVTVTYDDQKVSIERIKQSIEDQGYDIES